MPGSCFGGAPLGLVIFVANVGGRGVRGRQLRGTGRCDGAWANCISYVFNLTATAFWGSTTPIPNSTTLASVLSPHTIFAAGPGVTPGPPYISLCFSFPSTFQCPHRSELSRPGVSSSQGRPSGGARAVVLPVLELFVSGSSCPFLVLFRAFAWQRV